MNKAGKTSKTTLIQDPRLASLCIYVFYAVGLAGMLYPLTFPFFRQLIPFALTLALLMILVFHEARHNTRTLSVFLAILLFGFVIEAVGVNTGKIFGHYHYGDSLGIKLLDTPVIIGLNWSLLIYMTAALAGTTRLAASYQVILASVLMLTYDVVLEQVAPKLGMWYWENNEIPLQNYLAWFVISLILHTLTKISGVSTRNSMVPALLASQFLFFLLLAVFL